MRKQADKLGAGTTEAIGMHQELTTKQAKVTEEEKGNKRKKRVDSVFEMHWRAKLQARKSFHIVEKCIGVQNWRQSKLGLGTFVQEHTVGTNAGAVTRAKS